MVQKLGPVSATYTYDNNGNTLTKVTSAGTTTYAWDYENRLTSVTLPGTGGALSFKYDALGRRVQKVFTQGSSTTTTNYLYDGKNSVADADQNGNILARYAAMQRIDEPLAELRSNITSYYSQDGSGSVTSLTTSAGALANTYTYDSFGKLTGSSGSIANRFQYTAREFDSETGLYYYRARYYDPTEGRFLSEDSFGFGADAVNFYEYVYNDPVVFDDPYGAQPTDPCKVPGICGPVGPSLYDPPAPVPLPVFPAPPPPNGWDGTGSGGPNGPVPAPFPGLGTGSDAERNNQYQNYKKRCNEQPPAGLSPCDLARWKLQRNIDCRNLRQAWDDMWMPGRHDADIQNLNDSIKNLEEWIRTHCKDECK